MAYKKFRWGANIEISKSLKLILLGIIFLGCDNQDTIVPTTTDSPIIAIIQRDYKKSSYELSNYEYWFGEESLFENGILYKNNNPLTDQQSCQIDINNDGLEDIFAYDGYDLNTNPTPNPPPVIYLNDGIKLNRIVLSNLKLKKPHGTKLLVGDFNNDSLADIFSLVAVDQPNGIPLPLMDDNCHLILNSDNGLNKVIEIEKYGYWYAGTSGDIDNDGDLDVIIFNMHQIPPIGNGVKNRILWNDGSGNFKDDINDIGSIPYVTVSELYDLNQDGFLDLVINSKENNKNYIKIFWGNGTGFGKKYVEYVLNKNNDVINIDFIKLNNDIKVLLSSYNNIQYELNILEIDINTILDKTAEYIPNNISSKFSHLRVQDIDKNGKIDVFSTNKSSKIRWEWDGSKLIKK